MASLNYINGTGFVGLFLDLTYLLFKLLQK